MVLQNARDSNEQSNRRCGMQPACEQLVERPRVPTDSHRELDERRAPRPAERSRRELVR